MQKLLVILSEFCEKWGMSVNMQKTKLIVFRNGGIIKQNEKCYFNGHEIESVPYYKYLGLLFSSRLSWSPAQEMLAQQASKAMYFIDKVNFECEFSFKTSKELFNKCIKPILIYGSEIWGINVH